MSKPIFSSLRQFVLSIFLRTAPPKPASLETPEPLRRDLLPENDLWMFDAPRELSAERADFGNAMNVLAGQLSSVRELLSRISPSAPVPAETYQGSSSGVVWSDTLLFDGVPAMISDWGEGFEGAYDEDLFDVLDTMPGERVGGVAPVLAFTSQ